VTPGKKKKKKEQSDIRTSGIGAGMGDSILAIRITWQDAQGKSDSCVMNEKGV
jgi:hypothetical protein